MFRYPWLITVLLFMWSSVPAATYADVPASGPPGYVEAITEAIGELEAGHYPEAREEFRRAHALFPNARTLRGLGMVEFELRNYGESARLLEDALASKVKPLEGRLREDTQAFLGRARRYLGEVHVRVEPSAASVIVDGVSMDLGPNGALLLEVGEHTLEVQAPGWTSERRVVRVQGGERNILRIALSRVGSHPQAGSAQPSVELGAPASKPSERQPAYKKWWVWTAVAVVAAAGATTAAFLLTRDREPRASEVEGTNTNGVSLQTLGSF